MSGQILKLFVWFLESRIFGPFVLQYLKDANLLTQVQMKRRPNLIFGITLLLLNLTTMISSADVCEVSIP